MENQSVVENATVRNDTQTSSINNTHNSTLENRNNTDEVSSKNNDVDNSESNQNSMPPESSENEQQTDQSVNNQQNSVNDNSVKEMPSPKVSELTITSQNKIDSEGSTTAATATVGKMHELITSKKGSAITDSAMSALSIIFVLSLLVAIAYGYYNKRNLN